MRAELLETGRRKGMGQEILNLWIELLEGIWELLEKSKLM